MLERLGDRLVGIVWLPLAVGIWQLAISVGKVNPALLPPPGSVFLTLHELVVSGDVVAPVTETLGMLLASYATACIAAIALGLCMGCNQAIYRLFEPLVELMRPVPKSALLPPLFLFLGVGWPAMFTVVTLGAFFPVLINTIQGVRGIDTTLIDTARTFRCSARRTVLRVILPATLPAIFTGMRVSLGLGMVLIVLAEMLGGEGGLGFVLLDMQRSFRVVDMYAWLVVLAAVGLGLSAGFTCLEKLLLPWRSHT